MVEFKPGMKKEELLAIAAANGITADDSMTKAEIIDALNAHNAQEAAGKPTEGATEGAESAAGGEGGGDTTPGGTGAEQPGEGGEDNGGSGTGDGGGEEPGGAGISARPAAESQQNSPRRATTRSFIAARPSPAGG